MKISPTFLVSCIKQQWEHPGELEQRIGNVTTQIEMHARQSDVTRRLQTVPGIGPITASALKHTLAMPPSFGQDGSWPHGWV